MKGTTAFILILVAAGLAYTFVMPEYTKIQALRVEASQYQDVLDNVSDLSHKRDELLVKYNGIPKEQVANLQKILPDNVNVVELALNLDSIASKYGISIKNVTVIDQRQSQSATSIQTPTADPYQKKVISFSFVANYDSFRKFERDVEQSMRILEFKDVRFQTTDSGLAEFHIQIETYWLK